MGDDANCSYNQCFVLTLQGELSVESLHAALSEVVRRHEALRICDRSGERIAARSARGGGHAGD